MNRKIYYLLFLLTGGCCVGPNYHPPQLCIEENWVSENEAVSNEEPPVEWWENFNDPLLTQYIMDAAACNYELQVAESNICIARAARRGVSSRFYPQINNHVDYTRSSLSENAISLSLVDPGQQLENFSIALDEELYSFGFDALWEIDLFGKIRREVQGATARIGSEIETRNDLMITIFGDVADSYISVRGNQALIQVMESRIALLEEKLKLVEKNVSTGLDPLSSYTTLNSQLDTLKSQLPPLISDMYGGIYQLAYLTGRFPEDLVSELEGVGPLPTPPDSIAVGLRSTLLRRRPDVRQAERELAAAVADVGVAVAEFFPNLELRGNIFQRSLKFENLWDYKSLSWLTGANLATPVFHGGELRANLSANQAASKAAFQSYMNSVLSAVNEAESAITNYTNRKESRDWSVKSLESSSRTLGLVEDQYRVGVASLSSLIDAKLNHLVDEENTIHSRINLLNSSIALYKALGGGQGI